MKRLSVGFIPIAQREAAATPIDDLVAEVGRVLGLPTVSHRAADYRGLVGALEQGTVHVAWVPPLIAARSAIAKRILPVGVAVRDGTTSYSAALITHAASKIQTPKDLSRSSAAWVDRESASGYPVVRMALRAAGISLVDAFGDETFARSHGEVARLVMTRAVDVGATYVNYLPDQTTIMRGGWTRVPGVEVDAVRVVARAGPIPNDFFAVHGAMPRAVVEAFATALVDGRHGSKINLYAKKVLRADGFVRAAQEHTTMLQDLVRTLEPPARSA